MAVLGRDDILGAPLKSRILEVPEWGGSVRLQEMSGVDREAFEEAVVSTNGTDPVVNRGNLRGWLASFSIVDEGGDRLFSDVEAIAALGKTSGAALVLVCAEIQEMNGLGDKEVGELVEDFSDGPSSDSTTA